VVNDRERVLAYEPYRRLAYGRHVEIHEVFRREKPSRVTFELEPIGSKVKLTVTHDEFEPGSEVHAAVSNGWAVVLASLKSLLETGRALAMTSPQAMQRAKRDAVARATGDAR